MRGKATVAWCLTPFVAIALLALVATACGSSSGSDATSSDSTAGGSAQPLKLGIVLPLSGTISQTGLAWQQGMTLYADEVNKAGGIDVGGQKYTLDLLFQDGKGEADAGSAAARKLVYEDEVKYVFGEILDPATAAIEQVTSSAPDEVLHLMCWVTAPYGPNDLSNKMPLTLRLNVSVLASHRPDIEYLTKTYPDAKKVAILYPDFVGKPDIDDLEMVCSEAGLEPVSYSWAWGLTDFVPLITKALDSNPDAIVVENAAQADVMLRNARDLGFKGPYISTSPTAPEFFTKAAGKAYATDVIVNGMDMTHPTEAMQEVKAAWETKFGGTFVSDVLLGYDKLWLFTQLMEKAGSADPQVLQTKAEQLTKDGDLVSVFGSAYFTGAQNYGSNRVLSYPVPVVRIMNGTSELIGLMPVTNP